MKRLFGLFIATLVIWSCANQGYRFEQLDGSKLLPLQFQGFYGVRDGAAVTAEGRFMDGNDSVTMDIAVYLRPPAEFQSGNYRATLGGKTISGGVDCPSLVFQGGQTALPSMGGVFILKGENNQPLYRVTIPATQLNNRR